VRTEYKTTDDAFHLKVNALSETSNNNGFESLGIEGDMYFEHQASMV
jgi:hypothetical protein